jgi:hypothetical protein
VAIDPETSAVVLIEHQSHTDDVGGIRQRTVLTGHPMS